MFSIGCGRLFEGTAEQMFNSLNKLKGLKDNISVYCAHEYTLANIEFASAVEPNNPALLEYQQSVKSGLAQGQGSIPTNIKREKALNPFLRVDQKIIKLTLQQKFQLKELPTEVESFALLRQWKDKF